MCGDGDMGLTQKPRSSQWDISSRVKHQFVIQALNTLQSLNYSVVKDL